MEPRDQVLHLAVGPLDDLAQLVTDFAAQHEKQAADLEQHATAWQAQQQQLSTQVGILTEQCAHITADYKALADLLKQERTG